MLYHTRKKIRYSKLWSKDEWKTFDKRYLSNRGLGRQRRKKTEIRRIIPENGKFKEQLEK